MSIDFQEIPGEWAVPGSYTEVSYVPSPDSLAGMPLKIVIIGPTPTPDQLLHENITIDQAEQVYGEGSILAQTVRSFLTEKPMMNVDAIGTIPYVGSKAAAGSILFSSDARIPLATVDVTTSVYLAGVQVSWNVQKNDSLEIIAENLVKAANANSALRKTGLIVKQDDTNKACVTITAGELGELTNGFDIRFSSASNEQIPNITVTVTPMQNGEGTHPTALALAALGETWYTDVILCLTNVKDISDVVAEAKRRKNAMQGKDMRVYVGFRGTQGQALELQQQFSTSEELILLPLQNPRCSPWEIGAAMAAQIAQSLNNDPARQLRTLPLNSLTNLGPEPADQFSDRQRSLLLRNGCSTVKIQHDGTMTLERVVTTRTSDPGTGKAVGIWDVMIPAIAARVRYEWDTYINETFARAKLADDDSPLANSDGVVTTKTLKASWVAQCLLYQAQGWIDDVATLGTQAIFSRNAEDRARVDSSLPIKPMGSLIVLANSLQLQV